MKEYPILFSTDMVKAILDGTKTQTRRVIKLPEGYTLTPTGNEKVWAVVKLGEDGKPMDRLDNIKCPYGQVGDRLWVRETWRTERRIDDYAISRVADAPTFQVWYKTTPLGDRTVDFDQQKDGAGKWRPSIHMPRWASRITLEITEVRVERVQEISFNDILAEGISYPLNDSIVNRFAGLWDSLNAKRGYGWDANPWVWAISFKVSK